MKKIPISLLVLVAVLFAGANYNAAETQCAEMVAEVVNSTPTTKSTGTATRQATHVGPANLYPDRTLTPGKAETLKVADLLKRYTTNCPKGKKSCTYSHSHRSVWGGEHTRVYDEYSVPLGKRNGTSGEVEHFFPLCAGGSNDISNLWYQPARNMWKRKNFGYHEKDRLETWTCVQKIQHKKLEPAEAFRKMTDDWVAYYQEVKPAKKVLTAEDFVNSRVERGSGKEEVTFIIEINPKLSPFVFRVIPDPSASSTDAHPHAGTIEISRIGDSGHRQVIEVTSQRVENWITGTFTAKDVNFDGYLDISVVNEIAGKWASSHYWLFDPASEMFITNRLTEELGNIRALETNFDPKSKTVQVRYLRVGEGVLSETYKTGNEGLTLVEAQEKRRGATGNWEIVTKRDIGGEWKIIKVKSVLTAEDFEKGTLERLSGLPEVETFVIEIHPSLPPFVFRLIPDLRAKFPVGYVAPQHIGTIEISKQGGSGIVQEIDVESHIPLLTWFTDHFKAQDVNFDGYLDIAVPSDFGAKWTSYHYWQFDPLSGRFVTNKLTRQLGKLTGTSVEINPKLRTIHIRYLINDQARIGETYRVEKNALVLTEITERQQDCDGIFRDVNVKIIKGKRDGKDVHTLEPCKQITQNIAGGQTHRYRILLDAGQSLRVAVESNCIDIVLTLFGPTGEKLAEVLSTQTENRALSWMADGSGIYHLAVRPLKKNAVDGEYWIVLEEPRPVPR